MLEHVEIDDLMDTINSNTVLIDKPPEYAK